MGISKIEIVYISPKLDDNFNPHKPFFPYSANFLKGLEIKKNWLVKRLQTTKTTTQQQREINA